MGCRRSLKVHASEGHLDRFKEDVGLQSEEQAERFYQDIFDFAVILAES